MIHFQSSDYHGDENWWQHHKEVVDSITVERPITIRVPLVQCGECGVVAKAVVTRITSANFHDAQSPPGWYVSAFRLPDGWVYVSGIGPSAARCVCPQHDSITMLVR